MPVTIFTPKQTKTVNARAKRAKAVGGQTRNTRSLALTRTTNITKFKLFWDLMDTIQVHGFLQASMSVIGRSAIGAWYTIKSHEDFPDAPDLQRRRLSKFYACMSRDWTNIKDFQSLAQKIMIGAMYLKYFGQCAYNIVRDEHGAATGLDFLPGFVLPNVDLTGRFLSPAFTQYPVRDLTYAVEFDNPKDIVFITNPDWTGNVSGGSDMQSLAEFTLPTDLYLQTAAREYLKNRDRPEAFYILPADISDEAFDDFVESLDAKYKGPRNVGKMPIAIAGELDIKELSPLPKDLPYQEARNGAREDVLAASGVGGALLGLSDKLASANVREMRREFHETTMIPLFRLIESALYDQVHVREFEIKGWIFSFNNPDFLTAVERATVHMRYQQMGALNNNEVRHDLGQPARTDPNGDLFIDELADKKAKATADAAQAAREAQKPQGAPPEGMPNNPDSPSNTGEPTLDNQDPPRGDQHNDTTQRAIDALRKYRTVAIRRFNNHKAMRPYKSEDVPQYLLDAIHDNLLSCEDVSDVKAVFNEVTVLLHDPALIQ